MPQKLGELKKGQSGRILSVEKDREGDGFSDERLAQRLMEIGLLEGSQVEVVHEAPISGDPIVVRVRGALIALRRNEANRILISLAQSSGG